MPAVPLAKLLYATMPCQEGGKRRPAVHAARVGLAEMATDWQTPKPSPDLAKIKERWRQRRAGQ